MRRITGVFVCLLLLGAWSSSAAWATGEQYTVTYSGAGTLTSQIKSLTSPDCGDVTEVRNETTHFSWVTHYTGLGTLVFGPVGIRGFSGTADPQASSLASNESRVT